MKNPTSRPFFMMSNSYVALIDPTATQENASQRAEALRNGLIAAGIISAQTSTECVFGGVGHLPGPGLSQMYQFDQQFQEGPPELHYWTMLRTIGVEIHAELWLNIWGFTVFDWTECPVCHRRFPDGHSVLEGLIDAAANFYNQEGTTDVVCPECGSISEVREWTTRPHLGLSHLAAVFWNWPDFESKGWNVSIPEIASQAAGVPLVTSFGHV